ncbi:LPXTG cell wall anchor domain-containing protein [Lactiplantibacillus daowaiensis]|uniref:LPXTG cell wall anchor domain-containing protein n=1 Tax=Lactiplantibacillus daowaiensis TaxID=2559918 RepID=A0ABW1S1Q3_9LACO|nr:LPXTG cell wall anchor domain-containing protein [Lactiplantibacillus daowaiensis]
MRVVGLLISILVLATWIPITVLAGSTPATRVTVEFYRTKQPVPLASATTVAIPDGRTPYRTVTKPARQINRRAPQGLPQTGNHGEWILRVWGILLSFLGGIGWLLIHQWRRG